VSDSREDGGMLHYICLTVYADIDRSIFSFYNYIVYF